MFSIRGVHTFAGVDLFPYSIDRIQYEYSYQVMSARYDRVYVQNMSDSPPFRDLYVNSCQLMLDSVWFCICVTASL